MEVNEASVKIDCSSVTDSGLGVCVICYDSERKLI